MADAMLNPEASASGVKATAMIEEQMKSTDVEQNENLENGAIAEHHSPAGDLKRHGSAEVNAAKEKPNGQEILSGNAISRSAVALDNPELNLLAKELKNAHSKVGTNNMQTVAGVLQVVRRVLELGSLHGARTKSLSALTGIPTKQISDYAMIASRLPDFDALVDRLDGGGNVLGYSRALELARIKDDKERAKVLTDIFDSPTSLTVRELRELRKGPSVDGGSETTKDEAHAKKLCKTFDVFLKAVDIHALTADTRDSLKVWATLVLEKLNEGGRPV